MSFSDETLWAYVDGALDAALRQTIEEALRADAALAARVARLRLQRGTRGARFVAQPLAPQPGAKVVQLASVRASRAAAEAAARKQGRPGWGWQFWSALVLALLLGVVAGKVGLARWQPAWLGVAAPPSSVISRDGQLLAQDRLAWALSQQLGGAAAVEQEVRVGLSFLSHAGSYCRTFTLAGASEDLAGIACRASDAWRIPVLVQVPRPLPLMGSYRQPGVEMPAALLEAIDQRIVGPMLDARAELEALRRGWQR